ncbi:ABC transporter permease [Ohtaekwangia kribbensis]|uniref:ABC transporter permease n=1 Tax=Ohtaekwangia kribbensis TaxID=688913 RepID=A0ABW3K6D7_9BACT
MIKNYFIIAWRSLIKNRLFSFINIFGLALAMSVGMMVMIRVKDSFSYDHFHPHRAYTYRITSQITNPEKLSWELASTPLPLQEILDSDTLAVQASTSLYPGIYETLTDGAKDIDVAGCFTQSSFFDVFGFTLLHGNARTALQHPYSVVLSKATAEKFFGSNNPVGSMLTVGKLGVFQITGVLNEDPGKTHIKHDVYIAYATIDKLETLGKLPAKSKTWNSFEKAYTYIVLNDHASLDDLQRHLNSVAQSINQQSNHGTFAFNTQKLSAITPNWGTLYNDFARAASWGKIITEGTVAFIILLAACFNYTSLSIARSLTRTREIGIRKIAGAKRSQIFFQYIVESIVLSLFSLVLAAAMLSCILEYKPFNDGYEFIPEISVDWVLIACFVGFALAAGLLAGIMPAWIQSSFKAVKMLRNTMAENIMGGLTLRKILLVFQFSISLVVLIFLTAFYKQFSFMENADQGFARENIVAIPAQTNERDPFRNEITRLAGVQQVGSISSTFGNRPTGYADIKLSQESQQLVKAGYYFCDAGAIPLSELTIIAGSNFDRGIHRDEQSVILNQKAVQALGLKNIHSALGETVWIDTLQLRIVGIVKDFYHQGVAHAISPMVLRSNTSNQQLLVKINPHVLQETTQQIEHLWNKVYPGIALNYTWLDHENEQRYDQSATISLLGFLAFMTVTIASLGLLGLVVFTVETRRKEISIRKIIGASVVQIINLLSKGYIKLLVIAGIIAIPTGYVLSSFFLMNFANRISMGAGSLLMVFTFLLFIGLVMIISQTFRASIQNPVKNLRND